jgi:hypothetical protein
MLSKQCSSILPHLQFFYWSIPGLLTPHPCIWWWFHPLPDRKNVWDGVAFFDGREQNPHWLCPREKRRTSYDQVHLQFILQLTSNFWPSNRFLGLISKFPKVSALYQHELSTYFWAVQLYFRRLLTGNQSPILILDYIILYFIQEQCPLICRHTWWYKFWATIHQWFNGNIPNSRRN